MTLDDLCRPTENCAPFTLVAAVCDLRLFPSLVCLELVGVLPAFLAPAGLEAAKARVRTLSYQVGCLIV